MNDFAKIMITAVIFFTAVIVINIFNGDEKINIEVNKCYILDTDTIKVVGKTERNFYYFRNGSNGIVNGEYNDIDKLRKIQCD